MKIGSQQDLALNTEQMSTKAGFAGAALFASLLVLNACGTGTPGTEGDCNARIEYEGAIYRSHNLVKQSAPTESTESGTGDVLDCDRAPVDQVSVHTIHGVDPGVAMAVLDRDWQGIYVLEGTRSADWPARIKTQTR